MCFTIKSTNATDWLQWLTGSADVFTPGPPTFDRLIGLVVQASASREEGPEFESRLRRDFFGV